MGPMELTKDGNEAFRLLDLPPEIWSRIVKLAVVKERPILIYWQTSWPRRPFVTQQPAITTVCRAVRAESLCHYYSANFFFDFLHWDKEDHLDMKLIAWLELIGTCNARSAEKLFLMFRCEDEDQDVAELTLKMRELGLVHRKMSDEERREYEERYDCTLYGVRVAETG